MKKLDIYLMSTYQKKKLSKFLCFKTCWLMSLWEFSLNIFIGNVGIQIFSQLVIIVSFTIFEYLYNLKWDFSYLISFK